MCYLASISTVELDDLQEDPGYTSYRLIPLVKFIATNNHHFTRECSVFTFNTFFLLHVKLHVFI